MDPLLMVGTAVTIFLGGVMQGVIGFAYGLFATPIMVWIRNPIDFQGETGRFSAVIPTFPHLRTAAARAPS